MDDKDIGKKLVAENLTYYRNIEYLKEMTKQASALLLRSNAVYENILDDVELTVKVRGLSDSTDNHSKSPEAACEMCGSFHSVPFCIVNEIDKEEKSWLEKLEPKLNEASKTLWKEPRKESISNTSGGVETWRKPHRLPQMAQDMDKSEVICKEEPWTFNIDSHASPEEILTSYEIMCTRYGESCGRRYLLASSLSTEPQLSPQLSSSLKSDDRDSGSSIKKFQEKDVYCHPHEPPVRQHSEEVKRKYGKVVDAQSICGANEITPQRRWKDILCQPKKVDDGCRIHPVIDCTYKDSEEKVVPKSWVMCRCGALDCDCDGKQGCPVTRAAKKCGLLYDDDNNYVCTIRNRMERRKQNKLNQRKSSMMSNATVTRRYSKNGTRRQSFAFNHLAFEETLTLLSDCIGELVDPLGDPEALDKYQKKMEQLSRLAAPSSMIPVRDWNSWYDNHQRQKEEETDEDMESMDSDILSSLSDISDHSRKSSDLDYKEHKMPPRSIPYASEPYKLLNRLFEKITLKLEKAIRKNSMKSQPYEYRPIVAYFFRKLKMLTGDNDELEKTLEDLKQNYVHLKNLTPHKIKKRSKVNRMNAISGKCRRVFNRRAFIEGTQLGKRFKYNKHTEKFTKGGNYLGFSPQKRKLLRMIESKRFESCDLVGNVDGRGISKKTVHDDYKLLCNLYNESSLDLRMNLLDEDLKRRKERNILRDYGEQVLPEPPECSSTTYSRFGVYPSCVRKYPEKHDILKNKSLSSNGNSSGVKSEKTKYQSSSSSEDKSKTSFEQKARVSKDYKGRRVSQNLLLGSQKDDGHEPIPQGLLAPMFESVSKPALLTNISYADDSRSSRAADFSPSQSISPPSKNQTSSSQRASKTSKNTLSDQKFFSSSRDPSTFDTRSSRKLQSSSKTQDSGKVKQKVVDPLPEDPSVLGSNREMSLSSTICESSMLRFQNRPGNSGRVVRESLIVEPGSRMISDPLKSQTVLEVLPQIPELDERDHSEMSVLNKERKAKTVPRPNAKEIDFLSDVSLTRLRAMKPADRLGPTKKRVFGVDIGQGIHYVQYLRDSAAGADDAKKQEMLNMLTIPREIKREKPTPVKPERSKLALASDSFVGSGPLRRERQGSENPTESTSRKTKMSVDHYSNSAVCVQKHPIKTLDQIYKEVHGINARNTPLSLIENDYEHELRKKQQLRKHKVEP